MSDLHPWRKGVFQEDSAWLVMGHSIPTCTWLALRVHGLAANSGVLATSLPIMLAADAASRGHGVVMMRRAYLVPVLKMMSRDPFSVRVLLGASCSRIEEVVHALECSTSLTRNFAVFVN